MCQMTKKFAAAIISANIIAVLLLYLSSQIMLLHLTATNPYLTVTGINIDKIYIGAVQPTTSATPLIISAYPNLPLYILLVPLLLNAYLTVKVWRTLGLAKKFPAAIIISNVIIGLLLYFSSQATLSQLVGTMNSYVRVSGLNFLSFFVGAVQVGSSPIPLVILSEPNLPSYVFMVSLILNAVFIIKLLSKKP
jgi:hypothetical protein